MCEVVNLKQSERLNLFNKKRDNDEGLGWGRIRGGVRGGVSGHT